MKPFFSHKLIPFVGKGDVVYLTDDVTYANRDDWRSELIIRFDELDCLYLPRNLTALWIQLYKKRVPDSLLVSCSKWTTDGHFKVSNKPYNVFGFGRMVALELFEEHAVRRCWMVISYEE